MQRSTQEFPTAEVADQEKAQIWHWRSIKGHTRHNNEDCAYGTSMP